MSQFYVTTTPSSVGGAGITFLASATAASSASLEFTSLIDSTYCMYLFIFEKLVPGTDSQGFHLRTSSNAGVSYDSGATDYFSRHFTGTTTVTNNDEIRISNPSEGTLGNDTNETASGYMYLFNPSGTGYTSVQGSIQYFKSPNAEMDLFIGQRASAADVDAVQFLMDSGNIASGTIKMYGMVTPS